MWTQVGVTGDFLFLYIQFSSTWYFLHTTALANIGYEANQSTEQTIYVAIFWIKYVLPSIQMDRGEVDEAEVVVWWVFVDIWYYLHVKLAHQTKSRLTTAKNKQTAIYPEPPFLPMARKCLKFRFFSGVLIFSYNFANVRHSYLGKVLVQLLLLKLHATFDRFG